MKEVMNFTIEDAVFDTTNEAGETFGHYMSVEQVDRHTIT